MQLLSEIYFLEIFVVFTLEQFYRMLEGKSKGLLFFPIEYTFLFFSS